ncbi:MAG: transcriptional regulator [Verrucomicrobia bacterium Tous-C9LFEB]|nr:MAG: transcriptional regulator [Verrucomicrobia bacterium Tous-C9LFEB]
MNSQGSNARGNEFLPSYAKVERELRKLISQMHVGERLKSERELCADMGVSRVTLRRAMERFHAEGFLDARRGGGTWLVREMAPLPLERMMGNRLIGLVVPTVENSLISRIVRGAEQCAADRGYHVALAHDHGDMDYQIKQLRRMVDDGVGGVAVYPDTKNLYREEFLALIREISKANIPLVMIDRYVPEIETVSVLSDNFDGMYAATEHMILTGHRRLALLSFGAEGGVADRDRRKGFLAALQDYGMNSRPVLEAELGVAGHEISARKIVDEWVAKSDRNLGFDGIVCMQDNMAYGAFLSLRDAGYSVPRDVALVGYDNLDREMFSAAGLRLTSVDQPSEEIGAEAARLLIDKMEGVAVEKRARHTLLKPKLVLRDSCGMEICEGEKKSEGGLCIPQ